jgi:uncharacterized SAM-dependent methyltransferase
MAAGAGRVRTAAGALHRLEHRQLRSAGGGGCSRAFAGRLRSGDGLLLGVDLVKDVPTLLAAYDDAAGVTAEFNLNLLARLNRELGANFNPARFPHKAIWNEVHSRMEMHLESLSAQRVRLRALGLEVDFAAASGSIRRTATSTGPANAECGAMLAE